MINLDGLTEAQIKEVEKLVERLRSGEDDFETFWKAYPKIKKTAKPACRKKWETRKPDIRQVLAVIDAMKNDIAAEGTKQQFIAQPLTWLNQGRYEDEIIEIGKSEWDTNDWERYINSGEKGANKRSKELNETNKSLWVKLYQAGKIH